MNFTSYEPEKIPSPITIVSRRGVTYKRYNHWGDWWIENKWDGPNKFIGAIFNLPKEIKEKAKKFLTKREIEFMMS